jgi:hypothetical protein
MSSDRRNEFLGDVVGEPLSRYEWWRPFGGVASGSLKSERDRTTKNAAKSHEALVSATPGLACKR